MHYVDVPDPRRVYCKPDKSAVLFTSGDFEQDGFLVSHAELRLYKERTDKTLGQYSLITVFVDTNRGSIESVFDEGFRGDDILDRTAEFVRGSLGLSGLVLRSIISLKSHIGHER